MSSFHKTSLSISSINGTKLKNNLPYVSSGIPSLDYIIGGGLPAGGIFLVEEDVLGIYSQVLVKYFLAEGVVCNHDMFVASADEDPDVILQQLPQPCILPSDEKANQASSNEMKIAWRYEGLSQVESSFGSNTSFGHNFDLSRYIGMDVINNCNIRSCVLKNNEIKINNFKNNHYPTLLKNIKDFLHSEGYINNSKKNNILRLCIKSMGSPKWMTMDCDTDNTYGEDLINFFYCLRVMLRNTKAVAFVTITSHLLDDDRIMKRILYSVDNAVRIESFAGSSKETNPVYSEYNGLFHVTKLSAVHSLVPYVPPSLDLAFKLRRKKFVIEKLHLPPELQESSEREQDDITAIPKTCGGFKKMNMDF